MASSEPPSDRWRRLVDRAAPTLRAVDEAIARNDTLKAVRADVVERVTDVIANVTEAAPSTVEGTVTSDSAATPATTSRSAAAASAGSPPAAAPATSPIQAASTHWTRDRVRRMAMAAGREAVRPAAPRTRRAMALVVLLPAAVVALVLLTVLRRRR